VRALIPPPTSYSHLEDAPKTGDICALLVPNYDQGGVIRAKLESLREQFEFGGVDVSPLHLLCQRFRADKSQLEHLKPKLREFVQTTEAIQVTGTDIEPFYSTFRSLELLKCRITPSEQIEKFVAALNTLLEGQQIAPLNLGAPEWVTLLEDIHVGRLQTHPYAHPLFVGQRLLISELRAPGRFKALYSFPLAKAELVKTQFS
jgi:hypothetical protein